MINPITPKEVIKSSEMYIPIPEIIISVFNRYIRRHWNGNESRFSYDSIVLDITYETGKTGTELYIRGWLDVEDIYRKVGWIVEHYNSGDENYFIFKKK